MKCPHCSEKLTIEQAMTIRAQLHAVMRWQRNVTLPPSNKPDPGHPPYPEPVSKVTKPKPEKPVPVRKVAKNPAEPRPSLSSLRQSGIVKPAAELEQPPKVDWRNLSTFGR